MAWSEEIDPSMETTMIQEESSNEKVHCYRFHEKIMEKFTLIELLVNDACF